MRNLNFFTTPTTGKKRPLALGLWLLCLRLQHFRWIPWHSNYRRRLSDTLVARLFHTALDYDKDSILFLGFALRAKVQ